MAETETPKPAGTASAPNPKTGSSDAARGLGGHSKDASHEPGTRPNTWRRASPPRRRTDRPAYIASDGSRPSGSGHT